MKNILLLILAVLSYSFCIAQIDPIPDGYYLKDQPHSTTKVYQLVKTVASGKTTYSVSEHYKSWNENFYFYKDDELEIEGKKYVKIFIPSLDWKKGVIEEPTLWVTDEIAVDVSDWDHWLLLPQETFNNLAINHYGNQRINFFMSALVVPFKLHPKVGTHQSSIFNSSFNAGTFLGYRYAYKDKGGVSIGGFLTISALDQNSTNNTQITDNSSQSLFALNYGGGVVFDIGKITQIGGLVGFDHAFGDLSTGYIYQDKYWIAFSVNFKFLSYSLSGDNNQTNANPK